MSLAGRVLWSWVSSFFWQGLHEQDLSVDTTLSMVLHCSRKHILALGNCGYASQSLESQEDQVRPSHGCRRWSLSVRHRKGKCMLKPWNLPRAVPESCEGEVLWQLTFQWLTIRGC